uniref:Ovule protein n=1 Tax=Heterorhabditis bacteriophora TaxID=37862 RepID=A0A1I7XB77_HETBA
MDWMWSWKDTMFYGICSCSSGGGVDLEPIPNEKYHLSFLLPPLNMRIRPNETLALFLSYPRLISDAMLPFV